MSSLQTKNSLWQENPTPLFTPLADQKLDEIDVCVIGGGISGLMTAYFLLKEGLKVVILDRDGLNENETFHTSAHISSILDEGFHKIIQLHGEKGANLAYESHSRGIDRIEQLIRDENIDCDYSRIDAYLFLDAKHDKAFLKQEYKASKSVGVASAEWLEKTSLEGIQLGASIRYPDQAQFHMTKFILGLEKAIHKHGGKIYTETAVQEVHGGDSIRVTTTDGGQVLSRYCVVATHAPITSRYAIPLKEAGYRTYMIGINIPRGFMPNALLWDTQEPYHYVRVVSDPHKDHDVLIVGGEDHKVGQLKHPEEPYARLEQWTKERLQIDHPISYRWSGQVMEPMDGLAYIGSGPGEDDKIFMITGDSGHGITHAAIASMILPDLIFQRENPWAELYSAKRLNYHGIQDFMRENMNSAVQYEDWLTSGDILSTDALPRGEGAVIRDGLQKVAVYRDSAGEDHYMSAVCTHLGGIVNWNPMEKSWDCPCHGSRFDKLGAAINGPANSPLLPMEKDRAPSIQDETTEDKIVETF